MTPLSSNTSLEFLVKDPNGQCYKIQLDPNHLENTKATLVCGEKEKSVKVIFNYSLAITNTEQVNRFSLRAPIKQTQTSEIRCIRNTRDLTYVIRNGQGNEDLLKIANTIIRLWSNIVYPSVEEIEEVTELLPIILTDYEYTLILKATFDVLRQHSDSGWRTDWSTQKWSDPNLLRSWNSLIDKLFYNNYIPGRPPIKPNVFNELSTHSLFEGASILSNKLTPINRDRLSEREVNIYLRALCSLVRILRMKKLKAEEEKRLNEHCEFINRRAGRREYSYHYVTNYAQQELLLSPDHLFNFNTIIDQIDPVMKSDAKINLTSKVISPVENWYVSLCLFRCLLHRNKLPAFMNLLKAMLEDPERMIEIFHFSHPFFLKGLVDMLNEIITSPQINSEIANEALDFLVAIAGQNKGSRLGILSSHSPEFKDQLASLAMQSAYNCIVHPDPEIRTHACKIVPTTREALQDFKLEGPQPFIDNVCWTIFAYARNLKCDFKLLKKPNPSSITEIFNEEKIIIPLSATSQSNNIYGDIHNILEDFIDDPKTRLATLQGPAGCGKSVAAKRATSLAMHQYAFNKASNHILYIDLAKLNCPFEKMISESLKTVLNDNEEQFAKMENTPFVLFLDNYELIASDKDLNILETNKEEIKRYPKAKFVFLHRRESNPTFVSPSELNLGKAISIQLRPFNKDQIDSFIWIYYKHQGPFEEFSHEYYSTRTALNILLESGNTALHEQLSNPSFLHNTAHIMPNLVRKMIRLYTNSRTCRYNGESNKTILTAMKGQFEREFLMIHMCLIANNERLRVIKRATLQNEEILRFQINFGAYLNSLISDSTKELNHTAKAPITQFNLTKEQRKALGVDSKKDEEIQALLESSLEYFDGKWAFRSRLIEQFFCDVARQSDDKKSEILSQFTNILKSEYFT